MRFQDAGALLFAALYLTFVFVGGVITGASVAWHTALLSAGLTTLCYGCQVTFPEQRQLASVLSITSVSCGVIAAFLL